MTPAKPKNIVICLDGTGNQIEENLSNVLKLYRTLKKDKNQIVFYDQGVGTLETTQTWGRWKQNIKYVFGLAFGYGLDRNVLQAYEFLVQNYVEQKIDGKTVGDQIYIFGFSRGAHTARVLAGLIYEIGILRPEQKHLSGAALLAYKQSARVKVANYEGDGKNFRRIVDSRTATVKFLGVFDTVSSVFVPNPNGLLPPLVLEKLPHTLENPSVKHFRHAISLDESRRLFRLDRWEEGQIFKPKVHAVGEVEQQDAKEVWFSGYHSDVGGGHERKNSGLSQYPLIWMLKEAKAEGLQVFDRMEKYVTGVKVYSSTTKYEYPEPKVTASDHNSMSWVWTIIEFLPKNTKHKEWPSRKSFLGYYLPRSEPRLVKANDEIHASIHERMHALDYDPENLREHKK